MRFSLQSNTSTARAHLEGYALGGVLCLGADPQRALHSSIEGCQLLSTVGPASDTNDISGNAVCQVKGLGSVQCPMPARSSPVGP